mgnify:FL=1
MKKINTTLCLMLIIFISCKKETNEQTQLPETDTVTIVTKEVLTDPDPTDTISAEAYGINSSNTETAAIVRTFLQNTHASDLSKNLIDEYSRKFIFFEYDLNGDAKKEIFVGLNGPYFCGSGGCTQYILDAEGNKIAGFTVADYPVVIDTNKTNGWNDLFMPSNGKMRIIKFDGKSYAPSNPSMAKELKVLPGDGLPRALNYLNEPYPWFKF